jgi:hypothetical protein
MTEDYKSSRNLVSLDALKLIDKFGRDRAIEMYLGAIDALTLAVFTATGSKGFNAEVVIDNTKSAQQPPPKAA